MDMQKAKYLAYKIARGCLKADKDSGIVSDLLPNLKDSDRTRVDKALGEIIDMCEKRSGPKAE